MGGPRGPPAEPPSRKARKRPEGGSKTLRLRLTGDVLKDDGFGVDPAPWSRQGDAVQRPQLAARMPDHALWTGFLRDPDGNLVGLMEEKR